MPGCSFSKAGISSETTSPSRPIAQRRSVTLSPAELGEHEAAARIDNAPTQCSIWLCSCRCGADRLNVTALEVCRAVCASECLAPHYTHGAWLPRLDRSVIA